MAIVYCDMCAAGLIWTPEVINVKIAGRFMPRYTGQIEQVVCPKCGGEWKQRRPPGEFTPYEDIPVQIRNMIYAIRAWVLIEEKAGVIRFVAGPGLPGRMYDIHCLLKSASAIAEEMEKHSWLVYF